MNTYNEVIQFVEQLLLKQLNSIEQLVLSQSWLGHTYTEIAQSSGYTDEYVREVGSQLWQELSETLEQRVTKRNLSIVLKQHQLKLQSVTNDQKLVTSNYLLPTDIEFPSSPLPLGSPQYINRPPIEELAYAEINRLGCLIRIKASAKMGKTSLLKRIFAHATQKKYKTVLINFQEAEATVFTCINKFLRWFCANISRQLQLVPQIDEYWDEDMGTKISCKIYFESYLLEQINTPIVLALTEVNRVFEYPALAGDFLPLLRSWHEAAQQNEAWEKLRLIIVHSTEIYVPLNLNQSPFNIGLTLKLPVFNLEQVQELADRYGLNWWNEAGEQYASSLLAMVGGHPYLVNLALYYLYRQEMTLEELLQTAPTITGIYSDHLRGYLGILQEQPQLASTLQQIITANESEQLDAIAAYKLESMGLIQLKGNTAQPSCELYRLYFSKQLGVENGIDVLKTNMVIEQENFSSINELSHQLSEEYWNQYLTPKLDQATHLANHSYFNQYLEAAWEQLSQEAASVSLILCEIENFDRIGDAHGLLAKDVCLQLIGNTILNCVSQQITCIARYEEQKFAALLPRTDVETTNAIADSIRESIKALIIEPDNLNISRIPDQEVTVNIGVVNTIPSVATDAMTLIAAAQESLIRAKERGCSV